MNFREYKKLDKQFRKNMYKVLENIEKAEEKLKPIREALDPKTFFDKLQDLDNLALKKFGKLTPEQYKKRLHQEIDELLNAFTSMDLTFELFDVIAFAYAYLINGVGFTHEHFEHLLLFKLQIVKDRLK